MVKVVSLDFDSTIACTRHRWPMIDRENGTDWEAYSMACVDDTPGPALPLAQMLTKNEIPFIIVSGRSECARVPSLEWLHTNGVHPWAVFLCDDRHNTMSHGKWKATRLAEIQRDFGWEISFHVDDIKEVAEEVEAIGIPVMLVHEKESELVPDHLG